MIIATLIQCQTITKMNARLLLVGLLVTKLNEFIDKNQKKYFKKKHAHYHFVQAL